ncbi:MAG: hypothetical protein HY394_03940 [Candidatus Diapherotrites archaeon]|nr:hypothetical protein [Candidatus Diapherotrites archaeon]
MDSMKPQTAFAMVLLSVFLSGCAQAPGQQQNSGNGGSQANIEVPAGIAPLADDNSLQQFTNNRLPAQILGGLEIAPLECSSSFIPGIGNSLVCTAAFTNNSDEIKKFAATIAVKDSSGGCIMKCDEGFELNKAFIEIAPDDTQETDFTCTLKSFENLKPELVLTQGDYAAEGIQRCGQ